MPSTDKPDVSETEDGNGHVRDHAAPLSRKEMKNQVDAAATVEGLTRDSFSHLDEKKILRKVDLQ
jgi:MFS transporter, ACS family, DAL5 transporter family protein